MKPKILFLILLFCIPNCKGPDKPNSLPTLQETPLKTKEELSKDLKSSNWFDRSSAITEISKLKDKSFLQEIRNLLKNDENPAVRGTAAITLGEWQDKSSTNEIINLFKDKNISTDTILDALTRMKDANSINSIIPFLNSENHTYRLLAVEAISNIGTNQGADKIISMANSNKDIEKSKTYAMVIGKLKLMNGESFLLNLTKSSETTPTLAAAYLALGRIKSKKSIPVLAEAIGKDFDKGRENSVESLKLIGDISTNSYLIEYLKNKNREIQFSAAEIISSLYDLKTAETISKYLDVNDKNLYAPSAFILGRYKYEPARKKIESIALDLTNPDREILAESLGWMQNKNSIPVLISILKEKNGEGRYGAAWSLGMLNAEESIEFLHDSANSNDIKLSKISIESLGQIHSPKSLIFLSKKVESNKEMSSVILSSIASIQGEDAAKVLDKFAVSKEQNIQRAALQAILQRKDKSNLGVLIQILESNNNSETISAAQLALKSISGENFSTKNEWINWYKK